MIFLLICQVFSGTREKGDEKFFKGNKKRGLTKGKGGGIIYR